MIKIQLNSNVIVRISSNQAEFYLHEADRTSTLPFLTLPSHQINRINDLIKGLQNLAIQDCLKDYTPPESPFKRSPNTSTIGDIQNH